MTATGKVLTEQLEATWEQLRELITACPDEQWRVGESFYFVPARQIYHLLDCAQVMLGNPPKLPPTPKPFGPHWDGPAESLPTRAQLLEMTQRVAKDASDWIGGLSDEDLLNSEPRFTGTGTTPLGHIVYAIRHNQYHTAVVNAQMRRRGLGRMTWQ